MGKLSKIEEWGSANDDAVSVLNDPQRTTIQLDIPELKLKRVLELLSEAGNLQVVGSDVADCDGENILDVILS